MVRVSIRVIYIYIRVIYIILDNNTHVSAGFEAVDHGPEGGADGDAESDAAGCHADGGITGGVQSEKRLHESSGQ